MAQETIDFVHTFYVDDEYSRQLPGEKDYVNIQKSVRKQRQLVLCNLYELFVAFKERNPDVKIGYSLLEMMFCYSFIRNTLDMCLYYSLKHHFVSRHSKLGSYIKRSCQ